MSFERLLNEKRIEKIEKTILNFKKCKKDLESSKNSLKSKDYEWAETIAYNAVLRAGMKTMEFLGYRAIGKEHHKNIFEFLKELDFNYDLILYFNKIRIKRNNFIYRDFSKTSKKEAEETIKKAELFVQKIRTFVQKIRTTKKDENTK